MNFPLQYPKYDNNNNINNENYNYSNNDFNNNIMEKVINLFQNNNFQYYQKKK